MSQHSPTYAVTIRLRYPDSPGAMGRITTAIGEADGAIGAVDIVSIAKNAISRDFTVNASDVDHGKRIVEHLRKVEGVEVVHVSDRVFLMHLGGKIEVLPKTPIKTRDDLSMAYTPGVARVCRSIADDPDASFALTIRQNTVAVVSDGSAVLGLGNIGPRAAMPVMEGKAMLFKEFAGVDAFPICLDTQDTEKIIETVRQLAPTFGGINLEDISAPRCIEIEQRLDEELEIPVFHDDQHGTAIVVLAGLMNALKRIGKQLADIRIVINGAGAAGTAICKLLMISGASNIIACDRNGALHADEAEADSIKQWLAENTNPSKVSGPLSTAIAGADVFIGVSAANVLTLDDIASMADDPIVFALANPDPEIDPRLATEHVRIMATGRSDFPNQINNVLCFPGLFRGVLNVRASTVNDEMKLAAAEAIAAVIPESDLLDDYIIPSVFDRRVATVVAKAVAEAAISTGVARRKTKASFDLA
ncbi:malate dehydrogenase (oxaloacetate-decarboxylating) [Neorhodopirellula lusitana]|uniref:Malate dehydrogenase (Oxaloacetate-decarboxylating) n=1 Tax=Neorhodopirellula lusitana TaxID=445327 RepID=A0ABY1QNK7_9BACT|nr:malic enzyme-like NAD(P)-binding protein [Neorhodopirellula lusitana]SMP74778.1 malate dehydrogenase (oxaloacetate-decarboxylating) [Neorhodopirellula lusitana]